MDKTIEAHAGFLRFVGKRMNMDRIWSEQVLKLVENRIHQSIL